MEEKWRDVRLCVIFLKNFGLPIYLVKTPACYIASLRSVVLRTGVCRVQKLIWRSTRINMDKEKESTQGGAAGKEERPFDLALEQARRTAFVARFIVLREAKRTKAHRIIEKMEWRPETTAEELYQKFRQTFIENGDNMVPVDRDLRRALKHADRDHMIVGQFVQEYKARAANSFIEALHDYGRSNTLLFGDEDQPKAGGWRMPNELEKEKMLEERNRVSAELG